MIKLKEIPEEGRNWHFEPSERPNLDDYLLPEVSAKDYNVDVFVRPIGNIFEVSVSYKVSYELLCSKCAFEFQLPIERTQKELLMVTPGGQQRIEKAKHTSKDWSDDLFCTELESYNFHLGHFLREVILSEVPNRALGFGEECEKEACSPFTQAKNEGRFVSSNMKGWPEKEKYQPFSALKDFVKAKSKRKLQ